MQRLRWAVAVFFAAIAAPTAVLVWQAHDQLKWEAFHRYRVMAEEMTSRLDRQLRALVDVEEGRAFSDYAFLIVTGDSSAPYVQRSVLSAYPVASAVPGLIGHFQVDAVGRFTTPLLPSADVQAADYGVSSAELAQRRALQERILTILGRNGLLRAGEREGHAAGKAAAPSSAPSGADVAGADAPADDGDAAGRRVDEAAQIAAQAAFERLEGLPANEAQARRELRAFGRVEDLKLDPRYQSKVAPAPAERAKLLQDPSEQRRKRTERGALPEQGTTPRDALLAKELPVRISLFESEIEPFAFAELDGEHFVLFRKVWREGERFIQGALIDSSAFVNATLNAAFRDTALSVVSDLAVAYRGDVVAVFSGEATGDYLSSADELQGALLYRSRLSAPLDDVELIFSIRRLPAGPAGSLVSWLAGIIALVLCGGFLLMYRLAERQIALYRQQQDFVSVVSHELKTPLTSIRMYGEMLREGWVDETKKRTYYGFIHDESERLSRLIDNVLQLARMNRNEATAEIQAVPASRLMAEIEAKIASQVSRMGRTLRVSCSAAARDALVRVDVDYLTQIVINLVDNAIKFSANAHRQDIEISCDQQREDAVTVTVRDYGPGVPKDQMKKIFELFYRSESALTRETTGTGIGLALVRQLADAMGGKVDVVNREPGAEFRLTLPAQRARGA